MGMLKIFCVDFGNIEQLKKGILKYTDLTEEDVKNSKWLKEYEIGPYVAFRTRIKNYEIAIEPSFDQTLWYVYVEKID